MKVKVFLDQNQKEEDTSHRKVCKQSSLQERHEKSLYSMNEELEGEKKRNRKKETREKALVLPSKYTSFFFPD